jgi:hypothetical protein
MTYRRLCRAGVCAVAFTGVRPPTAGDRANCEDTNKPNEESLRLALLGFFDEGRLQQPAFYKFPFVGAVK